MSENPTVPPTVPSETPVPATEPSQKPVFERRPRPMPGQSQPPTLEFGGKARLRDIDAEVERELAEAMGEVAKTLDSEIVAEERRKQSATAEGGPKKGRILRIHGADVFVELPGGRSEGLLPMLQFPDGPPELGTEVDVHIEGYDRHNGLLILTRKGAATIANWESVAEGMIVEARVTETNKGGLSVDVNGIRGFMPISQIDLYRVEKPEDFVNQRLRCIVTEVKPDERNLVVSRRSLLEREREEMREKMWQTLAEGQVHTGIVRSVKDFGAFVDIGGVDGLLHVSEMSWQRVNDVTKFVQQGQSIKVVVLKIDRETRKVGLGLKQLQPSPWDDISTRFVPNDIVSGKVTRLMEFGAFVEIEPGVEGLIHISELSPQRVRRVKDIVQVDQLVQVMVLSVEQAQKRISLSLKGALPKAEEAPPPEEEEEEEIEVKPRPPRATPLRGGIGDKPNLQLGGE
ncbi:MAG: S1 RNA-binding domain-containing protein [Gemmataceae bacterium]|nr:S1 RNA-binding domain-containing protein [Gemmataceae bacterium]